MSTILILGAGRSSASLITYLLREAEVHQWKVVVGDINDAGANERLGRHPNGSYTFFDIANALQSAETIRKADVVISLLPAHFHPLVAKICLEERKHLMTASYISDEMRAYHSQAVEKGLLFLNECGLDPGIDHMSAMQIIDRIHAEGGKVISFESFTGGLIAPQTSTDNPWRYKFTWNPRNVVMAGQGTAKYLEEGKFKYIPYQQLFKRIKNFDIPGYGTFEGYANRDSLKYIETYQLHDVRTMIRGTLRYKDFCSAWDTFVQLGCCDDSYLMEDVEVMTHRSFLSGFLPEPVTELRAVLREHYGVSPETLAKLEWSGFFSDEAVGLEKGTPAQILEHILNKKWALKKDDKDLIVMQHRFVYDVAGKRKSINASLMAMGDNSIYTAMAKTVGLPLGIAAKLLLNNRIKMRGVALPITSEFYEPILNDLKREGIEMNEQEFSLS